jgi:cell division protein FtsZ
MNPKIKVVGIGGSGSNTVSRMKKAKIKGVELIAINTDLQDLKKTKADKKIRIGKKLTKGLGTGMNPKIGKEAALEQREEILEALKGSDLVFLTAGFGGGTGSGALPIVAEIAKNLKILTVAIITKPFSFEGEIRKKIAKAALENLKGKVDSLILIKNDKLLEILNSKTSISNAFLFCDQILKEALEGISDLILIPGIINVDFANIKNVLKNSGQAIFGLGKAFGEKRVEKAANLAINSPLIDYPFQKAKRALFSIFARDLSLAEIDKAAKIISQKISKKAKIIFGAIEDKKLKKGEMKIIVVATGF